MSENAPTVQYAALLRKYRFGVLHEEELATILAIIGATFNEEMESEEVERLSKLESRIEGELWGILQAQRAAK